MAETIFRDGMIPTQDQLPPERTSDRVRLIFNLLRVLVYMKPPKREAALREIKNTNKVLHERVKKYLSELTEGQIRFFKGERPHFHEDGKLAIYHPIKDNPLLMAVINGEKPADIDEVTLRPRPKLEVVKEYGGIV